MIPTQVQCSIAIGIDKTLRQAKNISPKITWKEHIVVGVQFVIDFGIQIIEIGRVFIVG